MIRKRRFWLSALGLIAFGLSAMVSSDSYSAERKTPLKSLFDSSRFKQMTERSALANGYKKLGEAVGELKLKPGIYVKDFVKENRKIEEELRNFLRKKSVITDRRYKKDGACEIDTKIEVRLVVEELKKLYGKHLHSAKWTYQDNVFDNISVNYSKNFVEATGIGHFTPVKLGPVPKVK